jgi:hypothetical protein
MTGVTGMDLERGAQLLDRIVELNALASTVQAEAAAIAGQLAGTGVCEQLEGLPLESYLALQSRLRGTDAHFQVTAGEVLGNMPVTAGLLAAGKLSWSVAREIIWQVRCFGAKVRGHIDQRIAATVHDHGDLDSFDPDKLLWAVEQALIDAREVRSVERTEQRRARRNYLAVQSDFDGGLTGHFRFDPVAGAIILNALDDAADAIAHATRDTDDDAEATGTPDADRPEATDDDTKAPHAPDAEDDTIDGDGDGGGGGDAWQGWERETARGRQLATALQRLGEFWLSGGADRHPARPLLTSVVQIGDVQVNAAGTITLNTRGALPSITLRTLEALSTDADLRVVLLDGARPLATSAKLRLTDPSADTRFAVQARDLACRWPGSNAPIGWTDLDHLHPRADGGSHHPDNLVSLSRRPHRWKHTYGWQTTLDPDTGAITISRRDRTYRSLPPGTRLSTATGPPDTRPPGTGPPGTQDRNPRATGPPHTHPSPHEHTHAEDPTPPF